MNIAAAGRAGRDNYKLLIGAVVPRPIAWVSTLNRDGTVNLAPFSFFQAVASEPPTVIVSVGRRSNGEWKDTALNALERREFVVNTVNMDVRDAMNESSRDYPYGDSELPPAGLNTAPSAEIETPRVAEAPIALECRLSQTVTIGQSEPDYMVLFGEVVSFYVRDDLYFDGKIDFERLQPLGRLAGNQYSKPGEIIELIRPYYAPSGSR
jgi:flavin reductase (DIM6/NTAB) family NADH-FMN oxidoreductase RutF